MNLSTVEVDVLVALNDKTEPDEFYVGFGPLQQSLEITRNELRRACRSLARKGLAGYCKGLMTEEGEMAGAGYAVTREGRETLARFLAGSA